MGTHRTIVSQISIAMAGALAGALSALCTAPAAAESLTVVSWGGSYARACQEAYLKPFARETGIRVRLEDYNGGLSQVRAQVEAGNVHWDIVDLEYADLVRGCDEGLFEILDASMLAAATDGSASENDYYPDMISECGAGMLFYSTVYAYNHKRTTGDTPASIQDFFDLERFAGRRGMRRSPLANLEFALLADGVPPEEVYAVLDTPEGVNRAFRKLDTAHLAIVAGSSNLDAARRLIAYASTPLPKVPLPATSHTAPHAAPRKRWSLPISKPASRCLPTCRTRRQTLGSPCTAIGCGGPTTAKT